MNTWVTLALSAGIVALSAFLVAVEFTLLAARRDRRAEAADPSGSRPAASKSARDLSLLLVGSQLGITLCTLALAAVTKSAVHHTMTPVIEACGYRRPPHMSPRSSWP